MQNYPFFILVFLISSCVLPVDELNQLGKFNAERHQEEIRNYYTSINSKTKVLVKTKVPVREIQSRYYPDRVATTIGGFNINTNINGMVEKHYYSINKKSLEHAIVEAFEYCKRDNIQNYNEICELDMVNNFDASDFEKNYAKNVYDSNLFQITILNISLSNPSDYELLNAKKCFEWNQKILPTLREDNNDIFENIETKQSFNWTECNTNIRLNIDEILKLYERPKEWDSYL